MNTTITTGTPVRATTHLSENSTSSVEGIFEGLALDGFMNTLHAVVRTSPHSTEMLDLNRKLEMEPIQATPHLIALGIAQGHAQV